MFVEFDGRAAGQPVPVAFEGKVYDVTGSCPWYSGRRYGCARAGRDATRSIDETVHGREMPARVPGVGVVAEGDG